MLSITKAKTMVIFSISVKMSLKKYVFLLYVWNMFHQHAARDGMYICMLFAMFPA